MGTPLEKNSSQTRKRIENHVFNGEDGDEYEASAFGGFGDYFRRKKIKLQNLDTEIRAASPGRPQIFKGLVIHVSGYTQPPLHILHKELVQHGACFLQYLDGKTMATHIVASSVTPKKAVEFAKYRIVKPAWVTDSINAGKLLPWPDYRVIDEGPRQKVLKFGDGGSLQSQSNSPARLGYKEQTQNSFYTSQFSKSSRAVDSQLSALETPTKGPSTSTAELDTPSRVPMPKYEDTPMTEVSEMPPSVAKKSPSPDPAPSNHDVLPSAGSLEPPSLRAPDSPQFDEAKPSELPKKTMTSEEHNAWLLSDPHIRKASTANPNFLKQFYSESRLHHLSTWKAELKSQMQRLADEKGPTMKVVKRRPGARRYIMHVDFDSFFCAVSLKNHPEYVEKPTVIAHGAGNGSEIASCNYPARKYGVKNGMWMKRALELCPELKVLPYDFPAYEEASRQFYEAILDVGGIVQSVSIDEALLDITAILLSEVGSDGMGVNEGSIWREQEKADQLATQLRAKIMQKTGCAVSVGIGGNILLAKVALRKAKPNGQHQVRPEEVLDLLADLEVKSLPGVAYSIGGRLEEMGITYVKDIRATTKERLIKALGPKTGEKLWEYARGIDRTEVGDQPPRKSVSAEVSWGIRFTSQPEAEEFVMNLCKELERRLLNEQVKGSNLTVKIMRRALDAPLDTAKHLGHGKCDTFNKSTTFGVATYSAEAIGRETVSILRTFKFSPGDLRGLGVQLTKLVPLKSNPGRPEGSQRRLEFAGFGVGGPSPTKKARVDPIEDVASPPNAKFQTPGTQHTPFPARSQYPDPIEDAASPTANKRGSASRSLQSDPIEEGPMTPKKPKGSMHPAVVMAKHYESDPMARTPLNVSGSHFKFPVKTPVTPASAARATPKPVPGTQFVLPPNPDPEVVAQLPKDIRARLMEQGNPSRQQSPGVNPDESRSESPVVEEVLPSQIDPEVFNALPDDMKAEVLAQYGRAAGPSAPPQPRAVERPAAPAPQPKRKSPVRRGIKNMFKASERRQDTRSGLMQTNFLGSRPAEQPVQESEPEELDPAFLAELPEDLRREVIEDHRRRRLASRSGLNVNAAPSRRTTNPPPENEDSGPPRDQAAKITFEPLPPKMEFGSLGLTSQQEIKDMLDAWHAKTRRSGPHAADVEVFEKYLARVVVEERNMDKAVGLVRWLDWIVGSDDVEGKGKMAWRKAVGSVKDAVQKAVQQRGLRALNI